jgi:Kef-type K+ transport system membrane component KefB
MTPVAPLGAHALLILLLQLAVLLGAAMALGRLAGRLGMPAVTGELAAGVLLGPSLLEHLAPGLAGWLFPRDVGQLNLIDAVGQLGVLLLVGITGIHIDLSLLGRQASKAAAVSALGLLVPLVLGVAVAFLLPATMLGGRSDRTVFALFLGVALCVSAIPVVAKTLFEMGLLHRDIGQLIITAAAVDDMAGWFLLSIVSAMAATGVSTGHVATSVAYLVATVAFAALVGRPVARGCLRWAVRTGEPGVAVTTVVVMVLLAAAGTHALGMEPVLGALLCGIVLGSAPQASRADLTPLRTLVLAVLAPVFFATAGLRMDLTALGAPKVLLAGVAVLLVAVVGKFAGAYVGARLGRLGNWEALAVGAGLNARGVIEVIIAMVGLRLGILNTASFTVIVMIAIATSLMAPPLLRVAARRITVTPAERAREPALAGWDSTPRGR